MSRLQQNAKPKRGRGATTLRVCVALAACLELGGCDAPRDPVWRPTRAHSSSIRSEVQQGPVRAVAVLKPAEVELSGRFTLTVRLEWEPGVSLPEVNLHPLESQCRICRTQQSLPRREGTRYITEQTVVLEPLQPGQLTLAGLPISFRDRRSGHDDLQAFSTEPLPCTISTSVDSPELSLAQLHNLAGGLDVPERASVDLSWILGLAAALAGIGLLVWRRRRERQKARQQQAPEQRAQIELDCVLRDELAEEDVKRFYAELTGVVRRYLERRYQVHACEQTTEEFVDAVAQMEAFSTDQTTLLKAFLTTADRVKFAGLLPTVKEWERSLTQARTLIGQNPEEVTE